MRKILSLILVLVMMTATLSGCMTEDTTIVDITSADEADSQGLPVYSSLDAEKREIYLAICGAIETFYQDELLIGVYDNEHDRDEMMLWLENIYVQIIYEHPEYFWISPYDYQVITKDSEIQYKLYIKPSYLMFEKETRENKARFESKVDAIVAEASKIDDLYEKVLFVYDYILENTKYDYEVAEKGYSMSMSRSAYGCIVDGTTVCSGYSLAFSLIMRRLGIECGTEFNVYGGESLYSGHVWNYCKLEGEYYYFDLTWDDTIFDTDDYREDIPYSHCFFGITSEELQMSREVSIDAPTPDCDGEDFNYYKRLGRSFEKYDRDLVAQEILKQKDNRYIELRFDSPEETLKAEKDLMDDKWIFTFISGHDNVKYVRSTSNMQFYILLK